MTLDSEAGVAVCSRDAPLSLGAASENCAVAVPFKKKMEMALNLILIRVD